ncbi:hypothetical protein WDU94_008181 [Cyamophila willieti]
MQIALLLALVVFMTSSLVSSQCPNEEDELLPCRCSSRGGEIQLWCSHSDLANVLQAMKVASKLITQPIDEMILENNRLPSLPGQAFGTLKILRLMLRNNNLERVATNWLSGLETSLLELFLVESDLKSIPEDSLLTLPRLEAITILGGAINRVPTMSGLGRVRYIQIQAPIVERIPPSNFFGLPFLEQIHIINSPKLKVLDNDFLHDLPRLTMLNLTNCGINAIQPRALNRLPQLSEIILSYNDFTDATQVGLAIRDLQSLTIVRLDHNRIDRLLEATFVDIPSLKDLYINDNLIVEVRRGAFHRLPALRSLDLSNNRLRNLDPEPLLPVGSNSVEEVLLAHNDMEHPNQIRIIFSAFPNLRYLDLSYNRFQDIVSGTLRGHHKLEMLHLEHNNLIRVGREVFSNMPSLRELRLANNSLSNFLEFPLWNLPSLKGLDISRNKIQKLDRRILASLPSLRRLDLSGNIINTIDPMTFIGNLALEYVNISFNDIDMIYPHTFTTTQNLYELDVSHNRVSQVPVLPKAVEYLYASKNQIDNLPSPSSPDLQLPMLKLLDISENGIHRIPPSSMSGLASLRWLRIGRNNLVHVDSNSFNGLNNLQALDLHNNRILSIHDEALNPLPQLVELSLKGNRLESIPHELLKRNALLKRLDVSRNQMTDINFSALSNNTDLQELYASHNSLSEFPNTLSSLPKLKTLDLGNNRLTQLQSKSIASMPSLTELYLPQNRIKRIAENTFYKLAKLEILDLENNELEDLATHSVKSLPNLLAVSFARNKLSSIPSSALSNLPSLQSLELQENSLQELASDAFTSCPNLLMVNMSANQLNSLDQCGLHSMRNLEILDLSHNKISTFDTDSMHAMDSLVMLKLDNNKLCNIEGRPFDRMSHLRMVSLRDNKMTTLPEQPFVKLRNNIATLDIEGNPLKCSCSILWLQSWLAENREGSNGPRCADGTLLKEFRLSRKNCEETQEREVVPGCEASYRNKAPVSDNTTSSPPTTNSHTNPNKDSHAGINATQPEQSQHVIKHQRKPKQKPKPKPYQFTTRRPTRPPKPLPEETDYFQGYVDLHDNDQQDQHSPEAGMEQGGYSDQEYDTDGPSHEDISVESDSMEDPKFPDESEETYKDSYIQNLPQLMDKNVSSIPPSVLSHYVPGDTPTLYAGTRNKSSTAQQTSTSPRPLTTKPPSSFSFFGVPIPPISGVSFNNFWGTKNRDQNGRGRKVHGGKFNTPPPERPDPSNEGGFIPMLPGSGGFKPMLSPGVTSQGGGPISYQSFESGEETDTKHSYSAETGEYYESSTRTPPRHATISKVSFSTNHSSSSIKPGRGPNNKPSSFSHSEEVVYIENSTQIPKRPLNVGGSLFDNDRGPLNGGGSSFERDRPIKGGGNKYDSESGPPNGGGGSKYNSERGPPNGGGGSKYDSERGPPNGGGGSKYDSERGPIYGGGSHYENDRGPLNGGGNQFDNFDGDSRPLNGGSNPFESDRGSGEYAGSGETPSSSVEVPYVATTIRSTTTVAVTETPRVVNKGGTGGGEPPKQRPSPLTGFLAPGGQLPPYVPTGTGRPIITKVSPSTLTGGAQPGPGPVDDLQGFQSTLRLAKSPSQPQLQYYRPQTSSSQDLTSTPSPNTTITTTQETKTTTSTTTELTTIKSTTERPWTTTTEKLKPVRRITTTSLPLKKNSSMSWYFNNYNNTDMEPYVFAFPNTKPKNSLGFQIRVSWELIIVQLGVMVMFAL